MLAHLAALAIEGREICIGFQDLSTCFMSIAKEIQFELEAALGVEPEISAVIKALHTNVTGQFETEHGLSDAFPPWIEARARATRTEGRGRRCR